MKNYRYWLVRCRKEPGHLIPVRRAVDAATDSDRPIWPDHFDATCPSCAAKARYSSDEIMLLRDFRSKPVPLSRLPLLPAAKRKDRRK